MNEEEWAAWNAHSRSMRERAIRLENEEPRVYHEPEKRTVVADLPTAIAKHMKRGRKSCRSSK